MHQNSKIKTGATIALGIVGIWGGVEVIETAFSLLAFHPIGLVEHAGEAVIAWGLTKPLRYARREAGKRAPATV